MGQVVQYLQRRWTRERFVRHTRRFLPVLYRIARRLTREPADAEDLVHDTYMKAFQAFENVDLRSADACRAWLCRILVNTYRDAYRRQQRSVEIPSFGAGADGTADDIVDTAVSPAPDPEVLLGHKHFVTAAQAVIAALSPEVRLVVTLFFVEGLAYKEIAEIVGCPVGTVMSRLARGRQLLRHYLQEYRVPSEPRASASRPRPLPMPSIGDGVQ